MIELQEAIVQLRERSWSWNVKFLRGSWTTITGSSGSGKTTLLKLIAGFIRPVRGVIKIGGIEHTRTAPGKRSMAISFQESSLFHHLTAEKNLLLSMHDSRLSGGVKRQRIRILTEEFGLPGQCLSAYPGELSGGELSRMNLVSALLREQPILILDEPFASLNRGLRLCVIRKLELIRRQKNLTVICASHQTEELSGVTDQWLRATAGGQEPYGFCPLTAHDDRSRAQAQGHHIRSLLVP